MLCQVEETRNYDCLTKVAKFQCKPFARALIQAPLKIILFIRIFFKRAITELLIGILSVSPFSPFC